MGKKIITYLFVALAIAATVFAEASYGMYCIVKPMLMPALLLLLIFSKTYQASNRLIAAGLLFSWAGDVLLLFENKGTLFFISGLVCFLLTHICYIIYFAKIKPTQPSLIKRQPWATTLVIAYGLVLLMFLWPGLGEMKLPVAVYASVICAMVIASMHIFYKTSHPANSLFIAGAIFFAASDSLLAVNKFYQPFAGAGALVIGTYCAAQLLIVMGTVKRAI